MNLTPEQVDLLRLIVGVYREGDRSAFHVTHTQQASWLMYSAHPNVPITADDLDFKQLAALGLVQLESMPSGYLRGKVTASGIKAVPEQHAPKKRGRKRRFTEDQLQRAHQMWRDEKSIRDIAKVLYETLEPTE